MELQSVIDSIDKLEKKIDTLVDNYNKLATNNALIAQDLTRIISFVERVHKLEIKVATSEEKICTLEEHQLDYDKILQNSQQNIDKKIQKMVGYGWGLLLMVLTQILTFLVLIFHDKFSK